MESGPFYLFSRKSQSLGSTVSPRLISNKLRSQVRGEEEGTHLKDHREDYDVPDSIPPALSSSLQPRMNGRLLLGQVLQPFLVVLTSFEDPSPYP